MSEAPQAPDDYHATRHDALLVSRRYRLRLVDVVGDNELHSIPGSCMEWRHIIGVDEDFVALLAIVKRQRVVHLNEAEAPLSTVFGAPG